MYSNTVNTRPGRANYSIVNRTGRVLAGAMIIAFIALLPLQVSAAKQKAASTAKKTTGTSITTTSPAAYKPKVYIVKRGDILYEIAARPDIYSDKRLWPLIYYANRDILSDYRRLTEGQKLIIPSNVTQQEKEDAIQKSIELGWPGAGKKDEGAAAASYNTAVSTGQDAEEQAGALEQADTSSSLQAGIRPSIKKVTVVKEVTVTMTVREKSGPDSTTMAFIIFGVLAAAGAIYYFASEAALQRRKYRRFKTKVARLARENNWEISGSGHQDGGEGNIG